MAAVLRSLQQPLYGSEELNFKPPNRRPCCISYFQMPPKGQRGHFNEVLRKKFRRDNREWIRKRRTWMQGPRREEKYRLMIKRLLRPLSEPLFDAPIDFSGPLFVEK